MSDLRQQIQELILFEAQAKIRIQTLRNFEV